MTPSEKFVREVALLTLEGELDDEGDEYVWENDDAWATLYHLIEGAREIVTGPVECVHGHVIGYRRADGVYTSFNPCWQCECPAGGPHEGEILEETGTGRTFYGCENCGAQPPTIGEQDDRY